MTYQPASHWFYTFTESGYYVVQTYGLGDHPTSKYRFEKLEEAIHMVKCLLEDDYEYSKSSSSDYDEGILYRKKVLQCLGK